MYDNPKFSQSNIMIFCSKSPVLWLLIVAGISFCLPQRALAAEWVSIGFANNNIRSIAVDKFDKKHIVVNLSSPDNGQFTYRTIDGGGTWSPVVSINSICDTQIQNPSNKNEFWAGCTGGLFRSVDGGVTYTRSTTQGSGVYYLTFSNSGTLYYSFSNQVYRTTDSIIWEKLNLPNTSSFIANISVNPENSNEVYFSKTGMGAGLYRTMDGGISWVLVSSLWQFQNGINGFFFLGNGDVCATYTTGGEAYSADNGFTWSTFASPEPVPKTETSRLYYGSQNPDQLSNIVFSNVGQNGSTPRVYSQTGTDKSKNTVGLLPGSTNLLKVSQGTVFAFASSGIFTKGLWRNEDIATQPEYLTKHPVIIVPGILGSWWVPGAGWKLDPVLHTYDSLYYGLIDAGFEPDKYLFDFPYQWRNDNMQTAILLKEKINEAKLKSGSNKVDIVAHSMGGIISRVYVEGDSYENDIDRLIFLGTPQLGSLDSYFLWEGAYTGFVEPIESRLILEFILSEEAAVNGYFGRLGKLEYIRSHIKSIGQLLPIFSYKDDNNGAPTNQLLTNLFFGINKIRERGIAVINIASDNGNNTMKGIRTEVYNDPFFWLNGIPSGLLTNNIYDGITFDNGDGTVPIDSQLAIPGENHLLSDIEHRQIPNNSLEIILTELGINNRQNISNSINSYLFIKAYSPVDFYVIAPDGRRIGFNKSESIYSEIPNAFYSGSDSPAEFVTIPNPESGEYKIVTLGNASGDFTIESTYIDEALSKDLTSRYIGKTDIGNEQVILNNLNIEGGTTESVVDDSIPPTSESNISEGLKSFYSSPVHLSLSSHDDISGVKRIEYSEDGIDWNEYPARGLVIEKEGENTIFYRSVDCAGNIEPSKSTKIHIDTLSPSVVFNIDKQSYARYESLVIKCKVGDVGSGVNEVVVTLDNRSIGCTDQSISLSGMALGDHYLYYRVKDNADNVTEGKSQYLVKVTVASLSLDIVKMYSAKQISRLAYIKYNSYVAAYSLADRLGIKKLSDRILNYALTQLEKDKKLKQISEVAYNLLKEDILWLKK